jgi:hypothetical protein
MGFCTRDHFRGMKQNADNFETVQLTKRESRREGIF